MRFSMCVMNLVFHTEFTITIQVHPGYSHFFRQISSITSSFDFLMRKHPDKPRNTDITIQMIIKRFSLVETPAITTPSFNIMNNHPKLQFM